MSFNIAYLIVTGLVLLLAILYVSPYELMVDEEEDEL
jgi:hypothetical protein